MHRVFLVVAAVLGVSRLSACGAPSVGKRSVRNASQTASGDTAAKNAATADATAAAGAAAGAGGSGTCPSQSSTASPPTYAGSVAKILADACVSCHNGAQAPNMADEADATSNRAAIAAAVVGARMPPSAPLPAADVAALKAWAAPSGPGMALAAPTYEGTIKALVTAKCAWCHSAAAGAGDRHSPYLTSFDLVRQNAGSMLSHMDGSDDRMPPSKVKPQLDAVDLPNFQSWVQGGYQQGTPLPPIDVTKGVYYLSAIKNLVETNCVGCHKAGLTPPDLSTYQGLVAAASAALAAVQQGKMPKSGALAVDQTTALQAWVAAKTPYDGSGTAPPPVLPATAAPAGSTPSIGSAGAACPP